MGDIDKEWWPPSSQWPELNDDFRLFPEQALALLLLNEDIVLLSNEGRIVPMVNCSDVFAWGCADAEDIPLLGFDDEMEKPFWDLYEMVRGDPKWGSTQWCILKRKQRPQKPVERDMRDQGVWLPEFDQL